MQIKKMASFGLVLCWCTGMILAGSDGNHMPWPNILGVLIFTAASWLLGKRLVGAETSGKACTHRDAVPLSESADFETVGFQGFAKGVEESEEMPGPNRSLEINGLIKLSRIHPCPVSMD